MTTPYRIEMSIEMNGETYALRLGTNQLCEIEEKVGKSWGDILYHDLQEHTLSVTTLRQIVQVASITKLTLDEAGDLLDCVGYAGITEQMRVSILQQLVDAEATTVADIADAKASEVAH